jgi:hypothetical protein
MLKRIVLTAVVVGAAFVLVTTLPDIKRYIRIKTM